MSKKSFDISTLLAFAFTCFYLGVAASMTMKNENMEFAIYVGVVFILLVVLSLIHLQYKLTGALLWLFSLWGLVHMAGGLYVVPYDWAFSGRERVLYNLWVIPESLKFDQVVHAYGFGITTWLIWEILQKTLMKKTGKGQKEFPPTLGLLFLCVIGSMGLGALNEVIEFIATLTLPETNVGGYVNTGWDLVYNTIGAVITATLIFLSHRKN